jgi:hypothetical protein
MDILTLAQRLSDPDPHVRVETLRILAMVEETRALPAVRWIFQNDPEPGVREVANWAGRLLWQAHKRGHSTEKALEAMYNRPMSPENQARFLDALESDLSHVHGLKIQKYAMEQAFQRRLAAALRENDEVNEVEEETVPALPEPPRQAQFDQDDDMLDAGLTNLILE